MLNICPLCEKVQSQMYAQDNFRSYRHCPNCDLVYVPDKFHLSAEDEKKLYDLHENHIADLSYRKFLSQLYNPLSARLSAHQRGLDFGCGPGPALAAMFTEQGWLMSRYDKYYYQQDEVFEHRYDFITATEVFEHLHSPKRELERLLGCMKKTAYLGIMTRIRTPSTDFEHWYYKKDPTHICFYSQQSVDWIALQYNLSLDYISDQVIIYRKK